MFTGLVQSVGSISAVRKRGDYTVLTVATPMADDTIELGESIACDGVCLTVIERSSGSFVVEASAESAARTILGGYRTGARINLERALRVGDRLGGHFVSGHVDGVGTVSSLKTVGKSLELAATFDPEYDPLVIEKGSIAISGVSLTVNRVRSGWFSVNVIPHTVRETTIGGLRVEDGLNLEFDLIGKYILKSLGQRKSAPLTLEKLIESGW